MYWLFCFHPRLVDLEADSGFSGYCSVLFLFFIVEKLFSMGHESMHQYHILFLPRQTKQVWFAEFREIHFKTQDCFIALLNCSANISGHQLMMQVHPIFGKAPLVRMLRSVGWSLVQLVQWQTATFALDKTGLLVCGLQGWEGTFFKRRILPKSRILKFSLYPID